jgi:hypothetical protein
LLHLMHIMCYEKLIMNGKMQVYTVSDSAENLQEREVLI